MASSILLSNCQMVEIQRQMNSMSPIQTSTPINQTKLKRCTCCPYGYHIDLDFIRYCEELANNSEKPTNEQLERRNKRRQRKSLEVMLGFNEDWYSDYERSVHSTKQQELSFQTIYEDFDYLERKLSLPASSIDYDRPSSDLIPTQHATPKKPEWKNSMAQNEFVNEILFDVYKDFLRTLENTSTQSKYDIQTENDVHHDEVSNYLTETSSHHKENVLIESSCQKEFETITQYEMDDELPSKCSTIDASAMKIDELTHENRNLIEQLHIVQSQLTDNLNRVRQFEERIKLIPKLELQLSIEQVENRDLHLKLTNLEIMLKEKEKEIEDKERIEMIQKTKSVKLESFTDRFSQLNEKVIVPTQDASCSTTRTILRDIGILTVPTAVTTNTIATNTDNIKTNQIDPDEQKTKQKPILKSIAIQCDSERKIETKNSSTSTMRPPQNESIGIMAMPAMSSQFSTAKPETKSIGIECIEEKIEKRSIGTNPIEQQPKFELEKSSISLKLSDLDAPRKMEQQPLELSSSKKESKSIGIQYSTNVSNKFSQCQILPVEMPKVATKPQSTTTNDLTLVIHRAINTNSLPTTKSRFTNTDTIVTTNKSTNTDIDQQSISTKSESEQDIRKRDEHQCHNCLAKIEIKQRTIIASPKKTKITDATDSISKLHADESAHATMQLQSIISKPTTETSSSSSSTKATTTTTTTQSNKKITRQNTYTISAAEVESSQMTNATVSSSCPCPAEFIISQNACTKTSSVETPNAESHHVISDTATVSHHETTSKATASTSESTTTIRQQQTVDTDSEVMKLWGPSMKSPSTYSQLASSSRPRQKVKPSKEMQSALKVINDSLQKGQHLATTLKNANKIVQKEWFRISSTEDSQPFDVEDYLDCFEEYSPNILKYVVNLTDANGNTAMHYAVSHGNFDIVSILLDSKVCEINNTNNAGYTCVMLVSLVKLDVTEHCSVVKRLFQIADVNIRAKKHSQTALMLATSHGNYHMVRMLLEAGADINIQDEDGSTALMCAAEHGRMDIIKILLAHPECDSTIQDLDGSTALKISLDAGYRDIGVLLYAHEYMIKNKSPYASLQSAGAISRKHSTSLSSSQNVCVPSVISNNNTVTSKEGGSATNKETCET